MTTEQLQMIADDVKGYLNRGYRSHERIEAKQERIESWTRIAESTTQELKPVVVYTGPSNKVENAVCNILDLQSEIKAEIYALVQAEFDIQAAISELVVEPSTKALLEMRYLNYLKWEEIAVRLDYTFRWTMTLHKRALQEIREKSIEKLSAKAR